jgi:hypothetical protein
MVGAKSRGVHRNTRGERVGILANNAARVLCAIDQHRSVRVRLDISHV